MCRYNIAVDDAIMEEMRPTIADGMEESLWVQLQVNALFSKMIAERRNASFDDGYMSELIKSSSPAWKGVTDADAWIHELRGE